ncbi:MAG: SDR family NAD(P)-dependent oxidoreductase, partial [Myxococcales bacterium]|nr:SDR family NAD(P)-dependent oxidoreductase [Myxococcales bacterium]
MRAVDYFSGKRVIITGGSSGIGLAFALKVAGLGAEPVLVARRQSVLDEAKQSILRRVPGARVDTIALDVADQEQVDRVVGAQMDDKPADMLVNNAGVVMPGRFLELP